MKIIYKIIMFLSFCLIILIGGIRLCLTHTFIDLEYNLPSFPIDSYGFTNDIRTQYAYQSVDYLLGKMTDAEFQSLTLPDGKELFNERELSHMRDVRDLTQTVLHLWYFSIILVIIGIIFAIKLHWGTQLWQSCKTAGTILIFFIIFVILGVFLNFDQIFTAFHTIFFEGDTWLFYSSDSLIRLFPTPFWINVFIAVAVFSLSLAFLLYFLSSRHLKESKKEV